MDKFLKATEQIKINLSDIVGKRVMYSETNNSSEIHITDYLWNIYCGEDGGKQFLERIINGGNIKIVSEYFKHNLPLNENIPQWQRKIKRVILAIGLEVCGIGTISTPTSTSIELILGGSSIDNESIDRLLYRIFYNYNLNSNTNSVNLKHQGTKKIFIRDMVPKLYTVPSKYRFLDTTDVVSEFGVYSSVDNVKEEVRKIYSDTVQEFRELYFDITDAEFSNYIAISSEDDGVNLVMVDDSPINGPEAQDSLIITLSNIMNSTNKDDTNWEKKKEFILLFFKNLQERTINYK